MLEDELDQNLVFGQGPGACYTVANVVKFEPAGVALNLRLARHELADSVPGVAAKLIDKSEKFFVLN